MTKKSKAWIPSGPHFLNIFQVPCYQSPTLPLHNCLDIKKKTTKNFGHQWLGMRIIINVITQHHTPSMNKIWSPSPIHQLCNTNHSAATFSILCGITGSWGTQWNSWLRHHATSRKVAGLILDGVIGIFRSHNPSSHTMALGLTQPLTEVSTRNIFWGWKWLVHRHDNLTTFMCRLSCNLGASTSWNPQGL